MENCWYQQKICLRLENEKNVTGKNSKKQKGTMSWKSSNSRVGKCIKPIDRKL